MNDLELSVQDIKELMSAMHKNHISALRMEREGFRLELEGRLPETAVMVAAPPPSVPAAPAPGDSGEPQYDGHLVRSPIVGTFYASPAPDKPPFVKVGDTVKKGDVLFIIESMKLMNEVLCEQAGVVSQILVENAQPVEYGQPILCIE